jgi:hypothetical protein
MRRCDGDHTPKAAPSAPPTTAMSHTAIQERLDGNAVDWMEKVRDEQYRSSAPGAQSLRRGNAQAAARRHHDPTESLAQSDSRLAGKSKTPDAPFTYSACSGQRRESCGRSTPKRSPAR